MEKIFNKLERFVATFKKFALAVNRDLFIYLLTLFPELQCLLTRFSHYLTPPDSVNES